MARVVHRRSLRAEMSGHRVIGETPQGEITGDWSLIQIRVTDDETMRVALAAGWEPFAESEGFVLLRTHSFRPWGSSEPETIVGRWPFDPRA